MTRRFSSILANAGLFALLGACHQEQKAGHGTVSGVILPGSVSDAMLPYDAVKSKPPLAPVQASGPTGDTPEDDSADSADTSAAPADSAAPAAPASPPPATPAIGD